MLANVRAPAPRTCGVCHIYGHTRAKCPNIVWLPFEHENDVRVDMYKRAYRVCPVSRRDTFMGLVPFGMRQIMLEIPNNERNVPIEDINFNDFRLPNAHRRILEVYRHKILNPNVRTNNYVVGINVVCKPDIVSGNCMVCLEDKSPDEWVEFNCTHGYCIPCRKAMNNTPLSKNCPYCTQTINELRVTDINNL